MWKRICDGIIRRREITHQKWCLDNGVHYSADLYMYYLYSLETNKATHYSFLNKNIFIPDKQKEMILHLYNEVTTTYRRIRKCIWKYWESKLAPCNSVDLSFTPFSEYSSNQYFQVMDGRKKYLFTHTELYNIIESSLTNADPNLIANPLSIKNPYTGTIFTKPLLYHIYFSLKHVPLFFIHYMKVNFELTTFLLENECGLRQYNIHKKIKNLKLHEINTEIRYMIVDMYAFILDIDIADDVILFDCNVSVSRELLTHYYNYSYSLNPYQRLCECKTLIQKIKNMANKIHKNIMR
jgi:hypothetical protein